MTKEKEGKKIRLNKYISNAGICSRREADTLISKGLIKVNGKIIKEMGYKVNPTDKVSYKDQLIDREKPVYILLNKPKDVVTTMGDPEGRKTVYSIIKNKVKSRVFPVGRLDRNTTGLLLLTNDGDLTQKILHPKYDKKKIYHAGLDKPLTKAHLNEILKGFELEDGFINADEAAFTDDTHYNVGIEIHSGRNRIVRRIFEHLGYKVKKLDRVYFAGLTKKNLPRGKYRFLQDNEINMLKSGKYK